MFNVGGATGAASSSVVRVNVKRAQGASRSTMFNVGGATGAASSSVVRAHFIAIREVTS